MEIFIQFCFKEITSIVVKGEEMGKQIAEDGKS
jgi:hypothetical protein